VFSVLVVKAPALKRLIAFPYWQSLKLTLAVALVERIALWHRKVAAKLIQIQEQSF
jgi:hypothetical protein